MLYECMLKCIVLEIEIVIVMLVDFGVFFFYGMDLKVFDGIVWIGFSLIIYKDEDRVIN